MAWYPLAIILAVSSWFWMHGTWIGSHMTHAGLQDEASFAIWVLSAILAVRMLWAETSWKKSTSNLQGQFSRARILGISPLHIAQALGVTAVATLCLMGLGAQITLARENTNFNLQKKDVPADVSGAEWISSHTGANAVIMARYVPIVYHYSQRKIVWFPPSVNPELLMAGIQKHKIDFILVVTRETDYYLPPEDDCMGALLSAYPGAFELVYQSAGFRIFRPVSGVKSSEPSDSGYTH
ncbi:MAG: hypothetical protein ACRD51_18785 [Candidatus Acidiferrum sp.]